MDPRDGAVLVCYGTATGSVPGGGGANEAAVVGLGVDDARFSPPTVVSGRDAQEQPGAEARARLVSGPGGAAVAFGVTAQSPQLVRVARREADGSWAAAATAAATGVEGGARFPEAVTAALPADGAVVAAWLDRRYRPGDDARRVGSVATGAIAAPGIPFSAPVVLSPASGTVLDVQAVAAGAAAYVAWASPAGGPVRVVRRAPGAVAFGAARTLVAAGDGDVLLAGAGTRAIAGWQQGDRLRLTNLARRR